jgi:SnoaL-like domain
MRLAYLIAVTALAAGVIALAGTQFISRAQVDGRSTDAHRIAALESDLTATRQRLSLAEDYQQITNLGYIYGYYLDKALYTQLVDLFTDDVSLEYSGRGVYLGKAHAKELMKMMPGGATGLQDGMLQNHIQLQPVIHVAPDGKTAKGRSRALIMMGDLAKHSALWQEGIYENEYRKEDGVWKFSKVHMYLNVNADYTRGWANDPRDVPGVSKEMPPDQPPSDPAYKAYPAAFVPPFHYRNPVTGK